MNVQDELTQSNALLVARDQLFIVGDTYTLWSVTEVGNYSDRTIIDSSGDG